MYSSNLGKSNMKKLLIGLLFVFLICCIVFILYLNDIVSSTAVLISCVIFFIGVSLVTGELTNRLVTKKMNAKLYNPKAYSIDSIDNIKDKLMNVKASSTKYDYGNSFLFIKDNIAYKVVIINKHEVYFNNENKSNKTNNKLNECKLFYGFEIFLNSNDEIIKKIQLYSFQTEKVYYTGFYSNSDNELIQANYEEPSDIHKSNYEYLLNLIGAVNNDSK